MKYSREYILKRAFEVFMDKGYDSTSITMLQKELDMSRGAMYRYFKGKEELFISVVDEYFFRIFNRLMLDYKHDLTLPEFIENMYRRQILVINKFMNKGFTQQTFLNYTALIIQAAKHYPGFIKRFKEIHMSMIKAWKIAIENSIEAGQLKEDIDIDIVGTLFNSISSKDSATEEYDENKLMANALTDIETRRKVMLYLYDLIKS